RHDQPAPCRHGSPAEARSPPGCGRRASWLHLLRDELEIVTQRKLIAVRVRLLPPHPAPLPRGARERCCSVSAHFQLRSEFAMVDDNKLAELPRPSRERVGVRGPWTTSERPSSRKTLQDVRSAWHVQRATVSHILPVVRRLAGDLHVMDV